MNFSDQSFKSDIKNYVSEISLEANDTDSLLCRYNVLSDKETNSRESNPVLPIHRRYGKRNRKRERI